MPTIAESLDVYPAHGGDAPRPALVVLPGGGYQHLAEHEGRVVAEWLAREGFHAFVLRYPVAPHRHPAQVSSARAAMSYVRSGAHGFAVDPRHVGVLGSSAGGHLAGMLATSVGGSWGDTDPTRPDFAVLCYPVISLALDDTSGTGASLIGSDAAEDLRHSLSVDERVDDTTPPMFLWFTADDELVPVEHGMRLASAMIRHGRPIEFHVFPHGRHGLGLAEADPNVGQWTALCLRWLRALLGES